MPIPENAVKELLSKNFLRIVASHSSYVLMEDELDFGVDLSLRQVSFFEENGRVRYVSSGFAIDVQLKATCERHTELSDDLISYDLSVATYNNLVRRIQANHTIPLVLALFVLPDDEQEWLSLGPTELTLRRCAYVWRPAAGAPLSANEHTQRIHIPLGNRVDSGTLDRLFAESMS
jgi:hypothetical protein